MCFTASTIAGGHMNTVGYQYDDDVANTTLATGSFSFIGAGWNNVAEGFYTSITAGIENVAAGHYSNVVGGFSNSAHGYSSFIGGGVLNTAGTASTSEDLVSDSFAAYSVLGGGYSNRGFGHYTVIAGGVYNVASGFSTVIAGGHANTVRGHAAAVAYMLVGCGIFTGTPHRPTACSSRTHARTLTRSLHIHTYICTVLSFLRP